MSEITKFDASDASCLIESDWGQYGTARMIEIASEHGYGQSEDKGREYDIFCLSDRKLSEMRSNSSAYPLSDDEEEMLSDSADSVELWMNENIAPEGYQFGWYDGEFFLQSNEWFSEDSDEWDEFWNSGEYEPESNGVDDFNSYDPSDPYDKEYDVP